MVKQVKTIHCHYCNGRRELSPRETVCTGCGSFREDCVSDAARNKRPVKRCPNCRGFRTRYVSDTFCACRDCGNDFDVNEELRIDFAKRGAYRR